MEEEDSVEKLPKLSYLSDFKPELKSQSSAPSIPRINHTDENENISPSEIGLKHRLRRSNSDPPSIEGYIEPPRIIDIAAENYRFRHLERVEGINIPRVDIHRDRELTCILQDYPHEINTTRSVHFYPITGEIVPPNCHVFDAEYAYAEYNERMYERQQFALYQAALLCEQTTTKVASRRLTSPQTSMLHSSIGPAKPRGTLPRRGGMVKKSKGKNARNEEALDDLTDSLTIKKVNVDSPRRPNSTKNTHSKFQPAKNIPDHPQSAKRRYRSPPPRITKVRNPPPGSGQMYPQTMKFSYPEDHDM